MKRIRLTPTASITTTHAAVVMRSDLGTFQLAGEDVRLFLTRMMPLLDGGRTADEIAVALPDYSRESVVNFLGLLEQKGLVEPVPDDDRLIAEERFFRKFGVEDGLARLGGARVAIAGLEPWGAAAAVELAAAGAGHLHLVDDQSVLADDIVATRVFGPADRGRMRREAVRDAIARLAPNAEVTVAGFAIGTDDALSIEGDFDLLVTGLHADDVYLHRRLAAWAHGRKLRSLHGHLDGIEAWIGPAVVPGETACWNCFRLRRLGAADYPQTAHELDAAVLNAPGQPRARALLAPMAGIAGQWLAMEAIKFLAPYTGSDLRGRFMVHNLISGESTLHRVLRMPWCEICGGAASAATSGGGTTRNLAGARDAEELRKALEGIVDRHAGIIRTLGATRESSVVPRESLINGTAVVANYTDGTYRHSHDALIGSGKGLTEIDAMIGAAGEAIERYSAARYRKSDLHLAAVSGMREDFVDPRRLCLYSDEQYAQPGFPFTRFDPDHPIHWTKGWWLDGRTPVWVPALPTYFNFETHQHEQFCQVSSNGLAAGADEEDAALRALFELIERDAFMLTWLCQLPSRRIVIDDSVDPRLREMLRELRERGAEVELYLLDGTDIDIPTVLSIGYGDGVKWPAAGAALACHLDARVAMRKSILEQAHVGQYLMSQLGRVPIPKTAEEVTNLEEHASYYFTPERMAAFDFLRGSPRPPIAAADLPPCENVSLAACALRLEKAGVRVAFVDVTSPDLAGTPFRVARAIGTDVQPIHFGERFRRLGNPRLDKLRAGRPLNPDPHPLA